MREAKRLVIASLAACLLCALAYAEVGRANLHAAEPVKQVTCRVELTETALVVTAALHVERPARGEVEVPLFSTRFPLVGSLPDAYSRKTARIVVRADRYVLQLKPGGGFWPFAGPREADVTFSFRVPFFKAEDTGGAAILAEELKGTGLTPAVPGRDERVAVLPVISAPDVRFDVPVELYDLASLPAAPIELMPPDAKAGRSQLQRIYVPAPIHKSALVLRWRATPRDTAIAPVFRVEADSSISVSAASLRAESQLSLQVLQGELRGAKLVLPEGSQLRAISGEALGRWELSGGAVRVEFRAPVKGQTKLALIVEQVVPKAKVSEGIVGDSLGHFGEMVWWPVSVEGAQHESGRAYFRSAPGLLLKAADRKGFERISDGYAPDEAAGRQTLVLVYPRLPASLRLAVEPLRARVTANVAVLAQLERGVVGPTGEMERGILTQKAEIDYTVHEIGIRQLQVQVGPGADVLEVACPELLDHELKDGLLTVRLREAVGGRAPTAEAKEAKGEGKPAEKGPPAPPHPAPGPLKLRLTVQRSVARADGIVIPRLLAVGPEIERQTCFLGIAAGANIELHPQRMTDADQVDIRMLPEWVQKLGARLAYRYSDRPGSEVVIDAGHVKAEFAATSEETCTLTDDGWIRQAKWHCEVLRGEVFGWRLKLPEGVVPIEVKGTEVKSWELDPAQRVLRVVLARTILAASAAGGEKSTLDISARFTQPVAQRTSQASPAPSEEPAEQRRLAQGLQGIVLEGASRLAGRLVVRAAVPLSLRAIEAKGLGASSALLAPHSRELRRGGEQSDAPASSAAGGGRKVDAGASDLSSPRGSVGTSRERMEGQLGFDIQAADWQLDLAATPIEPVIEVRTVTLLEARPGQVHADASLLYTIQKAPINALTLRLPEGAVNSTIRGADIRSSKLEGRDWTLLFARKITGRYPLRVAYDYVIPAEGGSPTCASLETPGAARHDGFILLARDSDRIEVAVKEPKGLVEIDAADVPDLAVGASNRAIVVAYRYTKAASLQAEIKVLGRAEVLQAKAPGAWAETIVRENGQTLTQFTYDIRNANRQFLRVGLDKATTLLAAYVDGQPVSCSTVDSPDPALSGATVGSPDRAGQDTAGQASRGTEGSRGTVLVPLLGKKGTDRAVRVDLFYSQPVGPLAGGGRLKLTSPPVDVRTEKMSWAVYLPSGYRAESTRGNMAMVLRPKDDTSLNLTGAMFADEARGLARVGEGLSWCIWFLTPVLAWLSEWGTTLAWIALIGLVAFVVARRLRRQARAAKPLRRLHPLAIPRTLASRLSKAAVWTLIIGGTCLVLLAVVLLPLVLTSAERMSSVATERMGGMAAKGVLDKSSSMTMKAEAKSEEEAVYHRDLAPERPSAPASTPQTPEQVVAEKLIDRYDQEIKVKEQKERQAAENLAKLGKDKLEMGDARSALKEFARALGNDPKNKDAVEGVQKARAALGGEQKKLGDIAAEYASQRSVALEIQRGTITGFLANGNALFERGQYNEAIDNFAKAQAGANFLNTNGVTANAELQQANNSLATTIEAAKRQREEQSRLAFGIRQNDPNGNNDYSTQNLTDRIAARRGRAQARRDVAGNNAVITAGGTLSLNARQGIDGKLDENTEALPTPTLPATPQRRTEKKPPLKAEIVAREGQSDGEGPAIGNVPVFGVQTPESAEKRGVVRGIVSGRKPATRPHTEAPKKENAPADVDALTHTPGTGEGEGGGTGTGHGYTAYDEDGKVRPKAGPRKAEPAPDLADAWEDIGKSIERLPSTPEPPGKPKPGRPGEPRMQARATGGGQQAGAFDEQTVSYAGVWSMSPATPDANPSMYSRVVGGRQKGALPIAFELPSDETDPYVFRRPVTGAALGEIELDCRRVGNNRPAQGVLGLGIGGLAVLLVVGAVKGVRRRSKPPAP